MSKMTWFCIVFLGAYTFAGTPVARATVPYTEHFTSDVANWANGPGNAFVNFAPAGGPDGSSYASTTVSAFGAPDGNRFILFRGQDNFNSSNHAFEGNWLASGIVEFSDYVWHNAPIALPFWARFANPTGSFSAVGGDNGVIVPPNTWTKLTYKIAASEINVTLFPEGPPSVFNSAFSNIGRIQVGFTVPAGFGADQNTYTFGLDQPSIAVPEPAGWLLVAAGGLIGLIRQRRRS